MQERVIGIQDRKELKAVGKALSSDVRLDILKLLEDKVLNVNEIAEKLADYGFGIVSYCTSRKISSSRTG